MRRLLALILISALSASVLVAGPAAAAPASSDESVTAAKYNKKKCKKAKTKRAKKKYCKKKKAPRPPQTTTTTPQTNTTTPDTGAGTGTGTGTGTAPQVVRDDAGFTNALIGSKLNKVSEGSTGYGEYTWNFCAGGTWAYRSYYYAGSTVESNDGGSWQVVEGYHAANDPNYYAGIIQVSTSNGSQYRWGVELRGNGGYMKTNTSSFEEGTFTRTVGGAVC